MSKLTSLHLTQIKVFRLYNSQNRHSETTVGYCYNIGHKWKMHSEAIKKCCRRFVLTCKARKPATSHIFMGTLVHKRKMIQEYSDIVDVQPVT